MDGQDQSVERILARIAGRAHGIVTRGEALAAGVSRDQIRHRLRTGALLREYPGVYRLGHRAPGKEALYVAAVKACGKGAALSGVPAADLLGLVRRGPQRPEVTAPTGRRVKGIRVRRARRARIEAMTFNRVPVTTVARTLVDIAPSLSPEELARACHEAIVRYRCTPEQVEEVLARRPSSPGAGKLRRVLHGEVKVTLSKLERGFLSMLQAERLKLPETNVVADQRRVDCRWPEERLTVELDSYRYHRSRHAWEQDRQREREAWARGDQLRRYTHDEVIGRSERMLAELRGLLPGGCPG